MKQEETGRQIPKTGRNWIILKKPEETGRNRKKQEETVKNNKK